MFQIDHFTVAELTNAINSFPIQYGRVGAMGLFPERGVTSRSVVIDERDGFLNLLPVNEWGAPGTTALRDGRNTRSLVIPQTVHNDNINPGDVQDLRAFGTESDPQPIATELAYRLQRMRAKHDITLEWRRVRALYGQVLDADGAGVLLDLFTELGPRDNAGAVIPQHTETFALATAATNVQKKSLDVVRHIEDSLLNDVFSSIYALVSSAFFDALIVHSKVREAYDNYAEAAQRLGGDMRSGFTFAGITYSEYRGKATTPAGTVVPFIPPGEGIAFPLGTQNTFATYAAPADFNETVNTRGRLFYAKTKPEKFDRGWEMHTQSNNIPVCLRPQVLVKLKV